MRQENDAKLKTLLGRKGYSLTKPRIKVFSLLQRTGQPITISEMISQLKEIDKVSVYRTVQLYSELGIVHRVWNGFKSKIELSEEFSSHHHHFTCLNCGDIVTLKSDKLENSLQELEVKHKFALTQHSVELSGYCHTCKTVAEP